MGPPPPHLPQHSPGSLWNPSGPKDPVGRRKVLDEDPTAASHDPSVGLGVPPAPHSAGRYSPRARGGQGVRGAPWVQPGPVGKRQHHCCAQGGAWTLCPPLSPFPPSLGVTPNTHRVPFGSGGALDAGEPLVSFLPHLSWWSNEANEASVALGIKGSGRQPQDRGWGGSGTPQLVHEHPLIPPYLLCGRGLP